ncbi:MAG: glutamine-hydrolyzing carbamoyl-phosphate synthase small subunit [Clostridiales bacterium]|nr:glutamine-hydrolyzing carbamoyl-phosphate synthase small subunit [Clostridiales bacterium]
MEQHKIYLTLENGRVFEGYAFGAAGEATGEIVFTTGMTGYLETLTDPSYCGQIVVQTFPLIGNYGVIPDDFESPRPRLAAYVVREYCEDPSNFRCQGTLDAYLKKEGVTGLWGVDTRELTRIIRERGVMNAKITRTPPEVETVRRELADFAVRGAVEAVSIREEERYAPTEVKRRVALWDFGAKHNIRRELVNRGCEVVCLPQSVSAEAIAAYAPDGVMLSNGPGDPAENAGVIEELRRLCEKKIPTFGICLGHQLLALSQGGKTGKLKYGHRGANQPVKDRQTGRVYVTSQNHGYAVLPESLPDTAQMRFVNANDGTCEGIDYTDMPAFSVQFHPEASGGPRDTMFLFDRFIELMDRHKR